MLHGYVFAGFSRFMHHVPYFIIPVSIGKSRSSRWNNSIVGSGKEEAGEGKEDVLPNDGTQWTSEVALFDCRDPNEVECNTGQS